MDKKRIIVGISGASGMPLALELLRQLQGRREKIETHLLYTDGAVQTCAGRPDRSLSSWKKWRIMSMTTII